MEWAVYVLPLFKAVLEAWTLVDTQTMNKYRVCGSGDDWWFCSSTLEVWLTALTAAPPSIVMLQAAAEMELRALSMSRVRDVLQDDGKRQL